MLYRQIDPAGEQVSILGYGCMRFPRKNGRIDEERTEKQIAEAIANGVNYFDTAYIYPGSEATLGRILAKEGRRDKVYIATKMPLILINSPKDMENTLNTSLERLQTDHVDYYLMHNITSFAQWQRMCDMGVKDFLQKQKESGRVRHIGFSYHGDREQFRLVVDDYPWEFCQIQYNILDENFQAGRDGLLYAASKGIGVIAMEPLRGGLLSGRVPDPVKKTWADTGLNRTPADWALRWVWNHPEITLLLSGMNEEAHIAENLRIASEAHPQSMSEGELATVDEVKAVYRRLMKVGCTGCGYCMPCPVGVDIPQCFSYYNDRYLFDDRSMRFKYAGFTIGMGGSKPSHASLCMNCGKCEKHCPQSLPIRTHLKTVAREMEGFYFKPLKYVVRGVMSLRGGRRKKQAAE